MDKNKRPTREQEEAAEKKYPGATNEYSGHYTKKERVEQDVRELNNNTRNNEIDG